jgi:hypothetical protein
MDKELEKKLEAEMNTPEFRKLQELISIEVNRLSEISKIVSDSFKLPDEFLDSLDNSLYIYPDHYKIFKDIIKKSERSQKNRKAINLDKYSKKKKYSDSFVILSHQSMNSNKGQIQHEVTRETGMIIKNMYAELKRLTFENEKLRKEGKVIQSETSEFKFDRNIPGFMSGKKMIKLTNDTFSSDICCFVFKNDRNRHKKWELEDLIKGIGEDYRSGKNWYQTVYGITAALNNRIYNATKLEQYFKFKGLTFFINPKYLSS